MVHDERNVERAQGGDLLLASEEQRNGDAEDGAAKLALQALLLCGIERLCEERLGERIDRLSGRRAAGERVEIDLLGLSHRTARDTAAALPVLASQDGEARLVGCDEVLELAVSTERAQACLAVGHGGCTRSGG